MCRDDEKLGEESTCLTDYKDNKTHTTLNNALIILSDFTLE